MSTTADKVTAALQDAAREIARRCGHGRISRRALPSGGVRVVVHLDSYSAQHREIAEAAVYSRLEAAGVASSIAVL